MKLWVDDIRPAPEGWLGVTDAGLALHFLQSYGLGGLDIEAVSLDHDLGEESATGYDIAKKMVELKLWPKDIYCHSMNPVGRQNIIALLKHCAPEGVTVHD